MIKKQKAEMEQQIPGMSVKEAATQIKLTSRLLYNTKPKDRERLLGIGEQLIRISGLRE